MSNIQSLEDYKRLKQLGVSVPAIKAFIGVLEYLDEELKEMNRRVSVVEERLAQEDEVIQTLFDLNEEIKGD